jgi:hypothetical protein
MHARAATTSRRSFLTGLGAACVTAPLLPILNASAQEARFPKRLILFFTPHGTIWDAWMPTGTTTDFTLGPILKPLEKHQKKLVVLSGLNMQDVGVGAPHTKGLPLLWTGSKLIEDMTFTREDGSGGMYYGWNGGPSVDQVIAQSIGGATPYPSLEFGLRSGGSNPASRMIYSDAQRPLEPETDPWAAFTRLFAMAGEAQIAERLSAVDLLRAELARIKPRIASSERLKIEAHVDAIDHLEKRLQTRAKACAGPSLPGAVNVQDSANAQVVIDAQMQIITSALACDLTRIASFQYTIGDNDDSAYPWLGFSDGHHTLSHEPDSNLDAKAKLTQIYTWYATKFASLLDQLDAIPEGDGTLLDNSMVVWGSELGTGNSHSFAPTPFVVAGGASGAFKTGRWLDFGGKADHNRLLVSMCRTFGLSDVDTFGNTDAGSGPLPGF